MVDDIVPSDISILDLLRQRDSLSVTDLAESMQVTATAVRQRLTRLMDPEDARGHGDLNVRLHDEEHERNRGMSW